MSENIKKIKDTITPLLEQAGVLRSSIFGSFARGEETKESDIDILIEFPKEKSLLDLVDLEYRLEVVLGRSIDLLTYSSIHPRLKKYIEKDQIELL